MLTALALLLSPGTSAITALVNQTYTLTSIAMLEKAFELTQDGRYTKAIELLNGEPEYPEPIPEEDAEQDSLDLST